MRTVVRRPKVLGLLALTSLVLGLVAVNVWNYLGLSLPWLPLPAICRQRKDPFRAMPCCHSHRVRPRKSSKRHGPTTLRICLHCPPWSSKTHVYLVAGTASESGRILALDARSGQVVWQVPLNSIADYAPVVAGESALHRHARVRSLALDRHTGEERWSFREPYVISGRPVVKDGVLFLGSEAVIALDAATGQQRWRHELDERVIRPLAYSGSLIAAIDAAHEIYLMDAWNGSRRLSFPLWFNPLGAPMISSDIVAVAGDRAQCSGAGSSGARYSPGKDGAFLVDEVMAIRKRISTTSAPRVCLAYAQCCRYCGRRDCRR